MNNIHGQIQEERANAREVCEVSGDGSPACAAAWDVVEELQAEASHQRENEEPKTSFQQYCDDNPEAAECRVYDN